MADPVAFDDNPVGSPITGTTAQSLLGTALVIGTSSLAERTRFTSFFLASYLNNTGPRRNVDLDIMVNGSLAHRTSLYANDSSATARDIRAEHDIILTASNTAIISCNATMSASVDTGRDLSSVTHTEVAVPFDISASVTIDVQATLSGVSDLATHVLTPIYFGLNTLGSFSISVGGPGGLDEVPDQFPESWVWSGSAYTQPTGGFFPRQKIFTGPVEPNGINSPNPVGYDIWHDNSGA